MVRKLVLLPAWATLGQPGGTKLGWAGSTQFCSAGPTQSRSRRWQDQFSTRFNRLNPISFFLSIFGLEDQRHFSRISFWTVSTRIFQQISGWTGSTRFWEKFFSQEMELLCCTVVQPRMLLALYLHLGGPRVTSLALISPATNSFSWYKSSIFDWILRSDCLFDLYLGVNPETPYLASRLGLEVNYYDKEFFSLEFHLCSRKKAGFPEDLFSTSAGTRKFWGVIKTYVEISWSLAFVLAICLYLGGPRVTSPALISPVTNSFSWYKSSILDWMLKSDCLFCLYLGVNPETPYFASRLGLEVNY